MTINGSIQKLNSTGNRMASVNLEKYNSPHILIFL